MRIRSIRPEFWASTDVSEMDWDTRLIFIGLWNYVDDNAVGRDSVALVVAALFPHEATLTEPSLRVHGALKALHSTGHITRYTVSGRRYLHVTNFHHHQKINRPSASRYPLPDNESAVHDPIHEATLTEPSLSPHAILPIGEGEKGRRGEGEKIISSEAQAPSDTPRPRPDVDAICAHLADRIEQNGSKRPAITKRWRDAARMMIDNDGRSPAAVHSAIDWCQDDSFWKANILSLPKLRDQYDRLRLSAQRGMAQQPSRVSQHMELAAQLQCEEQTGWNQESIA